MNLKNNSGFSIAEILVATGMLGVVTLGIMQTMKDSQSVGKSTAQKFESINLIKRVNDLLKDPLICKDTFGGLDISSIVGGSGPVNIPQIKKGNDILIKANCVGTSTSAVQDCMFGKETKGRIYLKSMNLTNYNQSTKTATLELDIIKGVAIKYDLDSMSQDEMKELKKKSAYGSISETKKTSVAFNIDGSNQIIECITELTYYHEGACDQLGGTIDQSDKKCKSITFHGTTSSPTAVTSVGAFQIDGDLNVNRGVIPDDTEAATIVVGDDNGGNKEDGGLRISDQLSLDKNFVITEGSLLFGDNDTNTAKLIPSGNFTITHQGKTDDSWAKFRLGSTVGLYGKGNKLGVNVPADPDATLHVNGNAHLENDLIVDGDMTVNDYMEIGGIPGQFLVSGGKLQITGGELRITKNGVSQSSEGYNDDYKGAFGSNDNEYIATRYWVYELFDDRLGDPDTLNEVVNALQNYSGEPIDQLTWGVCNGVEGLRYNSGTKKCVYNFGSGGGKSSPLLIQSLNGENITSQNYLGSSACSGTSMFNGITTNGEMDCITIDTKMEDAIKAETRTQLTSWGITPLD
ncbi:MAG: hypothetical protein ACO20H_03745 [Bacteriovoracaceae bacterium]